MTEHSSLMSTDKGPSSPPFDPRDCNHPNPDYHRLLPFFAPEHLRKEDREHLQLLQAHAAKNGSES